MARRIEIPQVSARLGRANVLMEDVARLPYVSTAREETLRRRGMDTVGDLLSCVPRRYLDFQHALSIEQAPIGEVATIVASVYRVNQKHPRPNLTVTEVTLVDETGVMNIAFFRQPWLAQQLHEQDRVAVIGKVEFSYGFKQMSAPHFEVLDKAAAAGTILPVHPAGEKLSAAWMRRIVSGALEVADVFCDPLPARLRAKRGLMSLSRAYRCIHFPSSFGERDLARRRLAYDEVLLLQLALRLRNDTNLLDVRPVAHECGEHVSRVLEALPFSLSDEQQQATDEILDDMQDAQHVMNRLLLGDVGTGKTAVATVVLAACADTGTQACVMAPTAVLARQYASSCMPVLGQAGVRCALLTGSTSPQERDSIIQRVAAGELDVLFGTHSVLNEEVEFSRLSLVVIDEQHRFGVGQRCALRSKGPGADLLVMSATPIPRTLALSVYGDLDTSIIRHRPVPGAGVVTHVLDEANRDIAYGAVREALSLGRQAYVICPLVEPGEKDEELEDVPALERGEDGEPVSRVPLHASVTEAERLSHVFPDARIGLLHGKLSARKKDQVIDSFRAGEVDLLVSTTVVEVGVDVPNATVMLIENGERFGLATLHQLRGRVGRGKLPGTCYVIAQGASGKRHTPASDRLESLEKTQDGFALAEMDLRLRHEGEILGFRQHGGVSLRFVDLDSDTDIIEAAHADALELLRHAPTLAATATYPLRLCVVDRYGDIFKEVAGG